MRSPRPSPRAVHAGRRRSLRSSSATPFAHLLSCAASRSASACSTRCSHGSASGSEPPPQRSARSFGSRVGLLCARAALDIVPAVGLDDEALDELRDLAARDRLRIPRVVDGAQGPVVTVDGTVVINFASNDYLGLANDPRLARAAASALEHSGSGVGSSRLIVGNQRCHVELEATVSDWLRTGGARLFNSGYAANVGVLTTLLRPGDVVFS